MNAPRTYDYTQIRGWETDQNRVLRDTYTLLALSMLPTVAGAYFGTRMVPGLFALMGISPMIAGLVMLAISWFLIALTDWSSDSPLGVVFLALFTGFCGLTISPMISVLLHMHNGAHLIMLAAGATGGIFASLALMANFVRLEAQKWFGFLMIGFWVVFAVKIIGSIFTHNVALMQAGCAMSIILFSVWILFDIQNVVTGAQGNAIRAALSIYLNLFNVFVNILQLLMSLSGGSDGD